MELNVIRQWNFKGLYNIQENLPVAFKYCNRWTDSFYMWGPKNELYPLETYSQRMLKTLWSRDLSMEQRVAQAIKKLPHLMDLIDSVTRGSPSLC